MARPRFFLHYGPVDGRTHVSARPSLHSAVVQEIIQLVAGTPLGPDVLQVVIDQGVVAPPRAVCRNGPFSPLSPCVCLCAGKKLEPLVTPRRRPPPCRDRAGAPPIAPLRRTARRRGKPQYRTRPRTPLLLDDGVDARRHLDNGTCGFLGRKSALSRHNI